MLEKVNIQEKLNLLTEYWSPAIVGEVSGCHVKLARLKGEFLWHHHDGQDEMFLVISGRLTIRLRDGDVHLEPWEFLVIPAGVEHMPVARDDVAVMLFEPRETVNTGNIRSERTKENLTRL